MIYLCFTQATHVIIAADIISCPCMHGITLFRMTSDLAPQSYLQHLCNSLIYNNYYR